MSRQVISTRRRLISSSILLRLTKSAQITLLVTHSSHWRVNLDRRIALSGGKVSYELDRFPRAAVTLALQTASGFHPHCRRHACNFRPLVRGPGNQCRSQSKL